MARILKETYYLYEFGNLHIRCVDTQSYEAKNFKDVLQLFFCYSNFPLKLSWARIYIKEPQDLLRELYGKNI